LSFSPAAISFSRPPAAADSSLFIGRPPSPGPDSVFWSGPVYFSPFLARLFSSFLKSNIFVAFFL
jgi:hypothetical protein